MRTTVELPPALMRAAKARSAERGESLKALLKRAIETELGATPARDESRQRVSFPLFGNAADPPVNLSSRDLEQAIADADATRITRRHGKGGRSRRGTDRNRT